MIACAGDEIIADETSIVGSIGVVSASFGFDKAIAKIGVERRVYTAGTNKVMLDPFQPEKKRDIDYLKSLQLEIHQVFIDMVKARRGARLADSDDLFTGMFWTGLRGRELGLVDACGLMAPSLRERFGKDTELKLVTQPRSLFGRAQPGISADLLGGAGSAMAAELPGAVAAEMEQRALWARYGL